MSEPVTTIAITVKVISATLFAVGSVVSLLGVYYADTARRCRREEEELEEIKQNRCQCQCTTPPPN